jgi:hypothetical protein
MPLSVVPMINLNAFQILHFRVDAVLQILQLLSRLSIVLQKYQLLVETKIGKKKNLRVSSYFTQNLKLLKCLIEKISRNEKSFLNYKRFFSSFFAYSVFEKCHAV